MRSPSLRRQLAVAFAAWTAVGLVSIPAAAGAIAQGGGEVPWQRLVAFTLASLWLWALYSPAIVGAAERWPLVGRTRRLSHLAHHLAFALLLTALEAALFALAPAGAAGPRSFPSRFLSMLVIDLISYGAVAAVGSAALLLRQLREEEARSSRLAAQLATSQLSALRAQLHPHFFFNTLNAIAELIHRDPDAADRMVARLGAFLRRSLDVSDAQEVSLEEELEALDAYLDVVRLRFGDRLSVSVEVDPAVLPAAVPPLVLQPLVENALKHGLEPLERPGRLEIAARRGGAGLVLEVRDDGVGLPERVREGIGVRNTRDRLRQLYGTEGTLALERRPGGGAVARVSLPLRGGGEALPFRASEMAGGSAR